MTKVKPKPLAGQKEEKKLSLSTVINYLILPKYQAEFEKYNLKIGYSINESHFNTQICFPANVNDNIRTLAQYLYTYFFGPDGLKYLSFTEVDNYFSKEVMKSSKTTNCQQAINEEKRLFSVLEAFAKEAQSFLVKTKGEK